MSMKSRIRRKCREFYQTAKRGGWPNAAKYVLQELNRLCLKFRVNYISITAPAKCPIQVDIEVTSVCNLRCPSCPHSYGNVSAEHLMPDKLDLILGRLPFRPEFVVFGGVGEPLANPCLGELMNILANRKIRCRLFTNGTLLNLRAREMLLAQKNLKLLAVSIDGATKDSFEQLRRGANFEKWKEQVRELNTLASRCGNSYLTIWTHTVVSKDNVCEIPDIILLARELGFSHMHLIDMTPMDKKTIDMVVPITQYVSMIEEVIKIGQQLNLHITYSLRRSQVPPKASVRCLMPWNYILVKVNGDIQPCCALFRHDKKPVMGNILRQDFEAIWQGEAFRRYRFGATQGTNITCNLCSYY